MGDLRLNGHTTSFAGTSPVVALQNVVKSYIECSMGVLCAMSAVRTVVVWRRLTGEDNEQTSYAGNQWQVPRKRP